MIGFFCTNTGPRQGKLGDQGMGAFTILTQNPDDSDPSVVMILFILAVISENILLTHRTNTEFEIRFAMGALLGLVIIGIWYYN